MALTRRQLVGGGLAAGVTGLGGLGALEALNLKGKFDWRALSGPSAPDRYAASVAALAVGTDSGGVRDAVVHVSHSTHLIVVDGVRMLTDPWFYDPSFGALSHEVPPAVTPEHIGPLDVLLVTHRHADHFDPVAVDQLDKRALVVVNDAPLAERARALGFTQVEVLETWQELTVRGVRIVATPAVHDIPENGYAVLSATQRVYFAGDTALFDGIDEIAERIAPTVAIVPVDGTRLLGGKHDWVMDPDQAVQAVRRLGATMAMPSHGEAYFSDPLVAAGLATTVAHAPRVFGETMGKVLPGVQCALPGPGELVEI